MKLTPEQQKENDNFGWLFELEDLMEAMDACSIETADGCTVETDGTCPHGYTSPMLVQGMI